MMKFFAVEISFLCLNVFLPTPICFELSEDTLSELLLFEDDVMSEEVKELELLLLLFSDADLTGAS